MNQNKVIINKGSSKKEEYIKELVIARIEASSDNLKVMIGGDKELSKKDLINNVREGNVLGKEIIDIQLEFLKDMAEGKVYQNG